MKFVVGMVLGLGAGIAATLLLANRTEEEGLMHTIQHNVDQILASAKVASSQRQSELWQEFHERVPNNELPTVG